MKTFIIGIGGMTNGGKSTLSKALQERLPNSYIIAQDAFFKDDSVVPVDSHGFKQYDMLSALHMDRMMQEVEAWRQEPWAFMASRDGAVQPHPYAGVDQQVFVLIIEGFLIFNYKPLNDLMNRRYFLQIPYETCKQRRSSRVYVPPDPAGYFDGHVWPMYLKNRKEMEEMVKDLVLMDGLTAREELLTRVLQDVTADIEAIRDEGNLSALENWALSDSCQAEGSDARPTDVTIMHRMTSDVMFEFNSNSEERTHP